MIIQIMKPVKSGFWDKSFGKHKFYADRVNSRWELIISQQTKGQMDFVEFYEFDVRPTKRQIRQCKKAFRVYVHASVLRRQRQLAMEPQLVTLDYAKVK